MKRFLIYFSYVGTRYIGLQRVVKKGVQGGDSQTIQGALDKALASVFRQEIATSVSSRTDSGVHAISTTAQFDVDNSIVTKSWSPERFLFEINTVLQERFHDIRARRLVEVPSDFNIRSASSRSYTFHIGVSKDYYSKIIIKGPKTGVLPLNELYRCQFVTEPFDADLVKRTCPLLLGRRNFRSFMMSSKEYNHLASDHPVFTKTMLKCSFTESQFESTSPFDRLCNEFKFYDFHFESSGFLRRQVRRMVGALVCVGSHKIEPSDLTTMLENPSLESWNSRIEVAEPDGLFLRDVNYADVPVLRGMFS